MKQYKARKGAHISNKDAQVFGQWSEKAFPTGEVTPQELVNKARDKNCPVHHLFDWDTKEAARNWNLHQARMLISSVEVIIEETPVKAFHSVTVTKDVKQYVTTERAIENPEMWEQVLERAWREVVSWRDRYKTYIKLSPEVVAPIVDKINEVERIQK